MLGRTLELGEGLTGEAASTLGRRMGQDTGYVVLADDFDDVLALLGSNEKLGQLDRLLKQAATR